MMTTAKTNGHNIEAFSNRSDSNESSDNNGDEPPPGSSISSSSEEHVKSNKQGFLVINARV